MVTTNLTPALVQALIFFAALLLFLSGRVNLRKTIILTFRTRQQRLTAIRVISSVERVLGFYFATASVIYAALGVVMAMIAWAGGLSAPALWGFFAFLSSFIPYLGITMMTFSIAVAGILTHNGIIIGLLPATAFFIVHLVMENPGVPRRHGPSAGNQSLHRLRRHHLLDMDVGCRWRHARFAALADRHDDRR